MFSRLIIGAIIYGIVVSSLTMITNSQAEVLMNELNKIKKDTIKRNIYYQQLIDGNTAVSLDEFSVENAIEKVGDHKDLTQSVLFITKAKLNEYAELADSCSEEEKKEIMSKLLKIQDVFSINTEILGNTTQTQEVEDMLNSLVSKLRRE